MSERKIVQIAAAGVTENSATQCEAMVFALASDGTLWVADNRRFDHWTQLSALPQPEKPDDLAF